MDRRKSVLARGETAMDGGSCRSTTLETYPSQNWSKEWWPSKVGRQEIK